MEEITGPIIAITLALSSVFVPCCFIGGITGQFFRQFAVTIAVSTIISAVNALTMTPSRAVLIFKTEEGEHGHELKREALPWWIFGLLGGLLDRSGTGRTSWRAGSACRRYRPGPARPKPPASCPGPPRPSISHPALVAGLVVGWLIIRPGERRAGLAVPGLQPAVRPHDRRLRLDGRQVAPDQRDRARGLRRAAGADLLGLPARPPGLHPAAGPGPADPQRPVARLGVAAAHRGGDGAWSQRSPMETPGVAHTVAIAGLSFLLQANASNFGSMFIVLDPFDKRQAPGLYADDIMARLRKEFRKRVKDAVVAVRNSSPIPGLGVAGGYKLIVEDRGGRGLENLQRQTDDLVATMKHRSGPGHRIQRVPLAARRSSTWTSTGPRPRPWACRSTT